MSCAAVMLAKDEDDVIEFTVRHLLDQVDYVLVADNLSTDRTPEILASLATEFGADRLSVELDEEIGYLQSRKTSALALRMCEAGHSWILPCDADEWFYAPDGRRIADFLAGHAPDVQIVQAAMFHHIPTALDPPTSCARCNSRGMVEVVPAERARYPQDPAAVTVAARPWQAPCPDCDGRVEPNPFKRIGWRKREHGALPKVACRCRPDLVIHAGNHGASTRGTALAVGGLVVRHFSWRSSSGYVKKIRNGIAAYAATDLPETTGEHWRMWEGKTDEQIAGHYEQWFHSADPYADDSLIYDPAPGA